MVKENYLINEAAKEVHVESHVLRYWEEELEIPIQRNEQGHRIYTTEDIRRFVRIKNLKDQGLQLKAVKKVLNQMPENEEGEEDMKAENPFAQKQLTKINKNGEMNVIQVKFSDTERLKERLSNMEAVSEGGKENKNEIAIKMNQEVKIEENNQEKVIRMQYLFQKLIQEVIEKNNSTLIEKVTDNIRDDICKELDYQFRLMEEHEEERENSRKEREVKREEERRAAEEAHYKKIDELLRAHSFRGKRKKLSKT